MRVLHINVNYITSALHQTMIEHLNDTGVENRVFAPTYDKTGAVIERKDYVTVSECFKKWDRLFYHKKQKKIISSVLRAYDVSSFDLIHAYTLFTDGNVAMELSKKYGIPYVVAVRNQDVNAFFKWQPHLRPRGIKILRNASAVFFLSPAYMETVTKRLVPSAYREEIINKSYLMPNGIDDFWHTNTVCKDVKDTLGRFEKKELRCFYAGDIDANKNIELTLKALELFRKAGWACALTVVGKIVDRGVYDQLRRYSTFHYAGLKKKEELLAYYREADLFIMPSHTETFGLVYAEAMSQGLPVLYTKGQGFDGQFAEGEVGYSVDDNDPADLAEKIKRVISRYGDLSQAASEGSKRFCWDDICERYVSIYHAILTDAKTVQNDNIPVY